MAALLKIGRSQGREGGKFVKSMEWGNVGEGDVGCAGRFFVSGLVLFGPGGGLGLGVVVVMVGLAVLGGLAAGESAVFAPGGCGVVGAGEG